MSAIEPASEPESGAADESGAVKASASNSYLQRLLLLTVMCLGIGSWFLYDGAIAYPRQRVRALEYLRLEEEERLDEWPAFAASRGWSDEDPGEPKTVYDSYLQFLIAACLYPPGLLSLLQLFRYRKRWISLESGAIRTSWGRSFPLADIHKLDKRKWRKKGIAKLFYQHAGKRGSVTLDDWKFQAEPIEEILEQVQSLPGITIVHGPGYRPPPTAEDSGHDAPS